MVIMTVLDIHTFGLVCGFIGGLLLTYEAFAYLRTNTYALAEQKQRSEHGYGTYAPSRDEMKQEIKECYIPHVRYHKYVDAIGFTLISVGFFLELVARLL